MDWDDLELCFSPARLSRYKTAYKVDVDKAILAYPHNLQLAESLLPCLKVLEISLRNNVHARLKTKYGADAWWSTEEWLRDGSFTFQNSEIAAAKAALARRIEVQSPDKIVAELSFGFWTFLESSRV
ncbi:hypothetical protein [Robbsia andropogonis]|uniref:hypothetical protein n=1 Tax=Robbsia andropogonis TaxID=28092 RepID=UPI002A6B35C3|nr:hypothetical protein [Robbsia andropogonis]